MADELGPHCSPEGFMRCPDDGTCHHGCAVGGNCFRVQCCGPLSAAKYPDDRWPDEVLKANGVVRAVTLMGTGEEYIPPAPEPLTADGILSALDTAIEEGTVHVHADMESVATSFNEGYALHREHMLDAMGEFLGLTREPERKFQEGRGMYETGRYRWIGAWVEDVQ